MLNSPWKGFVILNITVLSLIIYIIVNAFADIPETFDVSKILSRNAFLLAAVIAFILISFYCMKLLFKDYD